MNTQENSAHSYTEGSECKFELSHDPTARAKEHVKRNLMQLFFTECYDEFHNDNQARFIFDWFYSKLSQKEQEIDRLKKERESISDLLAILHRDGGHYQEKHGLEKAIKDAIELIHTEWVNKDEVDRLKKQSCELWTLWESLAEAGQISVGEGFTKRYNELKEELEELKNITKSV